MAKYRKKPVVIDAVQYTGDNRREIERFCSGSLLGAVPGDTEGVLLIETLEGNMRLSECDWVIRGVEGEFYPCKPRIFEETYEPVDPDA